MGKGGGGGGASGMKSRVKLTVLLFGAMLTSAVLVIGWETSPLSAFLLDPHKQHTTRNLPGRKPLQPFPSLPPSYRTDERTNEGIEPADLLWFCVWLAYLRDVCSWMITCDNVIVAR